MFKNMIRIKKEILEELKDENIELKLSDIRKDVKVLGELITGHLDSIKGEVKELTEHVKKVNGNVAAIQVQANRTEETLKTQCETVDKLKKETGAMRWLTKNPRLAVVIFLILLYSISLEEIRALIEGLFK